MLFVETHLAEWRKQFFVFRPSVRSFDRFTIGSGFFSPDFFTFIVIVFNRSHPDKSPGITSVGFYFYSHVMLCCFLCFSWRRQFIISFRHFFAHSFALSHAPRLTFSLFSKWTHLYSNNNNEQQKKSRETNHSVFCSYFFCSFCDYIKYNGFKTVKSWGCVSMLLLYLALGK